jgi:hypothetical protein
MSSSKPLIKIFFKKWLISGSIVLISMVGLAQPAFEKKYNYFQDMLGRKIFQTADSGFFLQGTIDKPWRDCYLIKTNKSGDTLWTKTYGTDSIQFYCYDMARSGDGGYILTGDYQTVLTHPSMDSYVQKIDSNGNQIWFNRFGWAAPQGVRDHGELVKVLKDSSIIVEGTSKDIYNSIGNYQSGGVGWNSYLAKFDNATGNYLNVSSVCRKLDTSCHEVKYYCYDIEVINNKIYWLGYTYFPSTMTFGTYTFAAFNQNLDSLFTIRNFGNYYGLSKTSDDHLLVFGTGVITKMDTLGNVVWTTFNNSPGIIYDIKEISYGNYIAIGGNTFIELFDGTYTFASWKQLVYINKHDNGGGLTWSRVFQLPSGVNEQIGFSILESIDGGFAFTGKSNYAMWLVKTDSLGNLITTGIETPPKNNFISIVPNPFSSLTTIHLPTPVNNAVLILENQTGQTVSRITNIRGSSFTFGRGTLPPGVYIVRLFENSVLVSTAKVVIAE